jgi:tetratricopeptide (TPR) repeat protein
MDEQSEFAFDFFVSRCGAVGAVAVEVAEALEGAGYRVKAQDVDFSRGGDFVADIHDALVSARHLFVLHTVAYDQNYWTRKEFTNFMAAAAAMGGGRRICVLRCDESAPRGILANVVFGDVTKESDPEQRRQIILKVAQGEALARRRDPALFGGAMPAASLNFVGRTELLAEVGAWFDGGSSVSELRVAALVGMGGVGKTSAARALVDRLAGFYAGVWWLGAESRPTLLAGMADLAARLDPQTTSETDVEEGARRALRRLEKCERPYLLVIDNIDDQTLLDVCAPARGAHLLLTTRRSDWGGRAQELHLDVMPEDDAVAFLQARAGRKDEAGARRLASAVGCLPLALDHAGAYVKLTTMSFAAYAQRADALVSKAPKGAPYPMSLAATFSLAIEGAAGEAPRTRDCMDFFAVLAPDDIPLFVCDGLIDDDERWEALAALMSVSLVRAAAADVDEPGVSVHRLVQSVVRARLQAANAFRNALTQMQKRLVDLFPEASYDNSEQWPICARLLPHALALCGHAKAEAGGGESRELATNYIELATRAAEYLHGRSSFDAAAVLYADGLAAAETLFGRDAVETVRLETRLGNLFYNVGKLKLAEPLLRKASASTCVEPADRAAIATSLAELLRATGRAAEAEPLLREAIADSEGLLGRAHPDVVVRLNNLARVRQELGDLGEAEALFREAIEAGEASLGRAHPLVGDRLNNLAKLLQDKGRLDEAEALYRESIANGETALEPLSPKLAIRRQNLANLLRDSDRCDAAEPLYRTALEALRPALPKDHPDLARVEYNLARALLCTKKYDEAARLAEQAARVHAQTFGPDHAWTKDSRALVADLAAAASRAAE